MNHSTSIFNYPWDMAALEGLPNKIIAAQYKTTLPEEKKIVAELKKTQKLLEFHKPKGSKG